jgi:predicted GNAT family N-acyltransferase
MNERIRQLAEQAGYTKGHQDEYGRLTVMPEFNKEKFAELIVRECLNQCYNRGMNDKLYAGQLKAATYIEEHFGVEN